MSNKYKMMKPSPKHLHLLNYFIIFFFFSLLGAPSVLKANDGFVCYTITTPSPATQSVCTGVAGTNITVKTSTNASSAIRFVRFSTDQMAGSSPTATESNFIYSYTAGTYTDLAYVTPTGSVSPYTATYTFSPDDFPNTTNASITYYVYAVLNLGSVTSTCTINPAVEIQVVVKPKPTINTIADQYLCAGSASTAVTLAGSTVSSTTYSWTNSTTSIGLAASGSTTVPSFTAVNATTSPVTATVTAIATASSCISDAQIFKMVVYPSSATIISGVAFNDYNENGIREGAEGVQQGVVVNVYNSSGTLAGTSTTDANGYWSVTGLTFGGATNKYRVEFSIPTALSTAGLKAAQNGTNNKTDVQFVAAASCNINFGVNYPSNYSSSNPILATPCYTNGSRVNNSSDAAVILYKYNDRGQGTTHETIATLGEVGSVWGQTYNPANKKLYVSAVVKRHSDLPPAGIGAIYEIDLTTPTTAGAGTPTLWLDVNAATFVNQSNTAVNLGMPADPGIATRGLGVKTNPSRDNWAFDKMGSQGIGDIELSEDGLRLYVMDLTNRQVLCIDYATKKLIWKLAVSTPTCLGGSTDIRPWALKEHNGVLYVGSVCSGETNKNAAQLHYYIMKCNSLTAATSMSLAVDMGNSTAKSDGNWSYWINNPVDGGITTLANGGYVVIPQPIISDIEFDKDENMIIGVMDRVGHQTGRSNYIPNVTNTNLVTGIADGDITRAVKSGSTYTIETAPWTFFYLTAAIPSPPLDQFEGGLVVSSASGTNFAVGHMVDPFGYESAGTTWLKTSDGQQQGGTNATGRLEIIPQATSVATFGKANGLGDLSLLASPAPIQIGNYVWYDADKDGQQDATEGPLSNVTVELWKNSAKIASAVTNASGEYYFSDKNASGVTWIGTGADTAMRPSMAYELKVYSKQSKLDTTALTIQNNTLNNGNDQNDSDAFMRGDSAIISLTTGVDGTTNHTFDFGFIPVCTAPLIANILADTATCTNGVANNDAKITVSGITGGAKYSYGTNGITGLFASNATTLSGSSIALTGLTNPSVATTYTFRIYAADSTCYNDTTVVLTPSVCPPCSITATFLQNSCNNNSTVATDTDDYFTVTVSSVSAVNGGTSNKYEVILNGTVLNPGGTAYGTSVTVGTSSTFLSDGTTTYQLTVRDIDIPTCVTSIFTTTASASCSAVPCPTKLCVPVTVTRTN